MYANARRCRRHAILFRRDFSRKNYGESSQTIFNKLFSINILQIQKVEFVEVYQFLERHCDGALMIPPWTFCDVFGEAILIFW